MKILMIAPTPFFADRGCHTRIYGEISALQRRGHQVLLVTYGLGRDIDQVTTRRCFNFPWYRKLSAGPSVWKIFTDPFLMHTARRAIRKSRPDVVHAHLHEGAFIAEYCRLTNPGPLYIFDCQGSLSGELLQHRFVREKSLLYRFFVMLEKRINGWFPIVTQSENLKQVLISRGASPERIVNAMDAVDTQMFAPMEPDRELAERLHVDLSRPRVIYMGLLKHYQGTDVMLEAFAKVKKAVPDVQFIIVGFPDVEKYREKAAQLGLGKAAVFAGKVPFEETPRYLSLAPVAAAPKISLSEGDGKLYNYMAMGQGIVTFDRSISREILGECGLYAAMGDASDLADKLVTLLTDETLRRDLGEKARERAVRELSTDRSAEKIEEFYKSLMKSRKR